MGDRGDAEHLLTAMKDCQLILATFVGIPEDLSDEASSMSVFDDEKREMVTTDRSRVPEIAWRCAIQALDLLFVGTGFEEPGVELNDDEARAFDPRKESK